MDLLRRYWNTDMNKHYVNSCLRWLANELVPYYNNNSLPDTLITKIETFYRSVSSAIDWFNLTKKDVQRLGFLNWEDPDVDQTPVWFIPSWLFHAIPEGIMLYDKNGDPFTFHSDAAPLDVMFGCLTFGVKVEEEPDGNY